MSEFTNKKINHEVSKINNIQFGVLSDDMIKKMSC